MKPLLAAALLLALPALAAPPELPPSFRQKCSACHGRAGDGKTSMGTRLGVPDFTDPAWQKARTDAHIRTTILEGSTANPAMRGYKDSLTPAELDAILAFIRGLGGGAKAGAAARK